MLAVNEARQHILAKASPLPAEEVALEEALGRVLAEDVSSARTLPPWDNSQMDGYAVRAADLAAAAADQPVALAVTSTVFAGQRPGRAVIPGEAARIMTGAEVPPGADAVVMQEEVRVEGGRALFSKPVSAGAYVRRAGEDVREGAVALAAHARLGAAHVALLAAMGRPTVSVVRRPRVGVFSTGDELCTLEAPAPDKLVDSNSWGVAARVKQLGGLPVRLGIARDDKADLERAFRSAADCDVVVSSAGVSVGEHDYVREVLESLGVALDFWKVAMRPGKPLAFGTVGRRLYFGLPGNPVSSMVTFDQFVRPALLALQGFRDVAPRQLVARLATPIKKVTGLTFFVRARVSLEDGRLVASPLPAQGSHLLRSMTEANAYVVVGEDVEQVPAGAEVRVELFEGAVL